MRIIVTVRVRLAPSWTFFVEVYRETFATVSRIRTNCARYTIYRGRVYCQRILVISKTFSVLKKLYLLFIVIIYEVLYFFNDNIYIFNFIFLSRILFRVLWCTYMYTYESNFRRVVIVIFMFKIWMSRVELCIGASSKTFVHYKVRSSKL